MTGCAVIRRLGIIGVVVFSVAAGWAAEGGQGRPFRVEGTVEGRGGREDFQVHVWGGKWQVVQGVLGDERVMRRVAGSDDRGEIGFMTVHPAATNAAGSGWVAAGRMPFGGSVLPVLWLAFGSSEWFRGQETNSVRPVWDGRAEQDEGLRVVGRMEFGAVAPGLPRRLEFYNNGTERVWMAAEKGVKVFTNGWPFKAGYTNALLVAEGVVAAGGLEFPRVVEFWEFRRMLGRVAKSSNDLEVVSRVRMEVTNVLAGAALDSYLPALPKVARVEDFRLPAAVAAKGAGVVSQRVEYVVKDRQWPGTDEARWRYVVGPRWRRWGWWAGFGVATLVAGWGLGRAVRRARARRAAEAGVSSEGGE